MFLVLGGGGASPRGGGANGSAVVGLKRYLGFKLL